MRYLQTLLGKLARLLPDKPFTYLYFFKATGDILNLKNPQTFGAKIQWLKIYGHLERYTQYADKYTVRPYVESKIGTEHLVPLLGVWDRFEDIPFDKLPNQFVLKGTHGCGYNLICKDKSAIDYAALKTTVDRWLSENYYQWQREPQYKACVPKVVAEKYLEDNFGGLRDYKFYCTNGAPQIIQVDTDRFTEHKSYLLDMNWKKKEFQASIFVGDNQPLEKPATLPKMLEIARTLSQDFPFVRVDLYCVGQKVYFGELTFTPGSGFVKQKPQSANIEFGKVIDLEAIKAEL